MEKIFENFDKQKEPENLAKEQITETLLELINRLTMIGNYEIIDKAARDIGVATRLAKKLNQFNEKLGNKSIDLDSSAQDVLRSIDTLLAFVEKIKIKGENQRYAEIIKTNIIALEKYMDLLESDKKVEKSELHKGFIKEDTRSDKIKYIEKIEEQRKKAA